MILKTGEIGKLLSFDSFLYCNFIILKNVLSEERYKHILLLLVTFRILCNFAIANEQVSYARKLLKKFFYLRPTYYDLES